VGCGYGALLGYLGEHHPGTDIDYLGYDISPSMIRRARELWRGRAATRFAVADAGSRVADYSVASGLFNVSSMSRSSCGNDSSRGHWLRCG